LITLTEAEIATRQSQIPEWECGDGELRRELKFKDFVAAFGCMAQIALVAERIGHHPDWHQVYNRLSVRLTTHDAGGLTELDFDLARHIDVIVAGVADKS